MELVSLRKLEALLGRPRRELFRLAARAGGCYRSTTLPGPKARRIDRPHPRLKRIQRRIHEEILRPFPLPLTMLGGVPGRSIRDNARPHVGRVCVVRIDLRDCFRRVPHTAVFRAFRERIGASGEIAGLLTRLTTLKRALPQGAPTSPLLANLCLLPLHEEVAALAGRLDLAFTQWIDDLVLSGDRAADAIDPAIAIIRRHGHGVRCRKIRRMGRGVPQVVTGVVVNRKPSAGRRRLDAIRKRILEVAAAPDARVVRSVRGQVAHVRSINEKQGRKLARLAARVGLAPD
jgi:RNA-directed DNA polymerase